MTTSASARHLEDILAIPAKPGVRHLYGEHPEHFIELFGNPERANRLVLLIHGGYFRQSVDLVHLRPLASALAESGALVAVPEYRRVGGDGGHPRTLEDVEASIAFTFLTTPAWGLSLERARPTVVAGHSAGGSLVLSWASRQPASGRPVRLVPLAPISDHVREARGGLGDGAVLAYYGVHPDDDPRPYLAEDPRSRIALIPERFEIEVVHGDEDPAVDIGFSRALPLRRKEIVGGDHFDVIDPNSRHFESVRESLLPGDVVPTRGGRVAAAAL